MQKKKIKPKEDLEEKEVHSIIKKVIALEKKHNEELIRRACYRYVNAKRDRVKAEREIKELTQKLDEAKKKLI